MWLRTGLAQLLLRYGALPPASVKTHQ